MKNIYPIEMDNGKRIKTDDVYVAIDLAGKGARIYKRILFCVSDGKTLGGDKG